MENLSCGVSDAWKIRGTANATLFLAMEDLLLAIWSDVVVARVGVVSDVLAEIARDDVRSLYDSETPKLCSVG